MLALTAARSGVNASVTLLAEAGVTTIASSPSRMVPSTNFWTFFSSERRVSG